MDKVSDGLRACGIEGLWIPDASIILTLKRLTAVVLITIAMLLGSVAVGADSNAQTPYWAGRQVDLASETGTGNPMDGLVISINYSEDGKKYSATVLSYESLSEECEGRVFKDGDLEPVICSPDPEIQRELSGNVTKIILNDLTAVSGVFSTYTWIDKELKNYKDKKVEEESDKRWKATLESRKAELARKRADEERQAELARKRAEEERKAELARKKADAERKAELARKKAEAKKRKSLVRKINTKASAKQFLSDIRSFIKENPGELDPLTIAKLYVPSTAEAKEGKFSNKNSKFRKLVNFAGKNQNFKTYYRERSKQRAASLKKDKLASLEKLKSGVKSLKDKIASDPLNPSAVKWVGLVKEFEKINIQSSLNFIRKQVVNLDKGMRASGVKPDFSVAQNIPSSGTQKLKPRNTSSKTKRSSLNLEGVLDSDLIALAHVSSNSPNAYRDLDGKIKFEENKIIACAPSIKNWKSQEQYYFDTQFSKRYRNAEIHFQKDCSKSLNGIDLLIVKGIDFSKSLKIPNETILAKAFRTKELSIIVKATEKGLKNERTKREILSDQYKADILGDSRLGYGALTVNKRSEIGCIVLDQDLAPHQNSINSAIEARTFQFGDRTPNLLKVDTATAFRQLQRGKCGIVYGNHNALKKILEGSGKINLSTVVLPVWISQRSIDKETERLSKESKNKQLSEAQRTSELKRRLAEEKLRKQKEAAALSNRQSEHRKKYGPKVTSLISVIESELIKAMDSVKISIQANKNLQESVTEHQFYSPFPSWYGKKIQGGWLFDSVISAPHDYGIGTWRNRQMEGVISKVRVLMKNRKLGEYSDDCWFVGYLIDSEFNMYRNPTISMCKNQEVHKNWLIDQGFETRWKFVPEG